MVVLIRAAIFRRLPGMSQEEHIDLLDRFDTIRLETDDAIAAENWTKARTLVLRLEAILVGEPNMTRGANGVSWRGESVAALRLAIQASGSSRFHETKIQHALPGPPI